MSADELTKPLGLDKPEKKTSRRSLPIGGMIAGLSLAFLGGLVGYVSLTNNPLGGEPTATASIDRMPQRNSGPVSTETKQEPSGKPEHTASNIHQIPPQRPGKNQQDATELENDAGVRVMRQNGGAAPGSVVIRVPDAVPLIRLAPAPDKRLIERSRHGNLPKQDAGGLRPADVYARPITNAQRSAPIKIAIVVGGLGISSNATQGAIQRLAPAISLAFAPYGTDVERQVAKAREDGHEVLLHTPMEPFDYPDNDPGPHTLVANQPPEMTTDRMHWLMAQFNGYVGMINYMGGRFTSSDEAMNGFMKELSKRGLLYIDDGSSGRSVAPKAAAAAGASFGRTDVVIDAVQRSSDIDAALSRLEKLAREKGSAVGYAAGLPLTVDRIARWTKAAEARGITLVPVSALVTSPKRN
jgi:uncharacterized protein